MDKSGQEWVSAAVDGEVDAQSFAELAKDIDSHQEWRNYHLIGDALRSELPSVINLDLSAAIADAIDKEPTVFAPAMSAQVSSVTAFGDKAISAPASNEVVGSSDTKTAESKTTKAKVLPFLRPLGQYVIAASVALFAVIGVQQMSQVSDAELAPLPVLNTRPLIGNAAPVSFQASPVQQEYSNEQVTEQRRRINHYLQDHMLQQKLNNGDALPQALPQQ
ncbi:anti-sigma factor [Shewanella sp. SNU WT4]|uniref:sigma-E factor negative regulatory protein n=1 Tax=Shewanella sp. SNU WT4 TaxID=2590015 RepID=UPI00112BFDDC|nr:RseA family anti-sigma factor [Shewanella sp. SNU WT4]QDF66309.1 anti-sigma factor [Shewanella sp. SNU WT4]